MKKIVEEFHVEKCEDCPYAERYYQTEQFICTETGQIVVISKLSPYCPFPDEKAEK